jgi:hypothetical protein
MRGKEAVHWGRRVKIRAGHKGKKSGATGLGVIYIDRV